MSMLSQLLTAVRNTTSTSSRVEFGQDFSHGLSSIPGDNDEPYSDRLVACVFRGRTFKAVSLSDALSSGNTVVEDSTGAAVHGYRVMHREGTVLSETSKQFWTRSCRLVNATLDGIFQACHDLGYTNLTRDSLRVVAGNTLTNIPNALPVLIMPVWDNALMSRSAIPAWDGHACAFELHGQYDDPSSSTAFLVGVNRALREAQTAKWLDRPGGAWKNGWYEDLQGMRWHSDMVGVNNADELSISTRFFDPSIQQEIACSANASCPTTNVAFTWSAELTSVTRSSRETLITVSNGTRFGLFYFRSDGLKVVVCIYDFAALLSNASVVLLLCRWMIAMVALHRGCAKRVSNWHSAGIGSIAHAPSFTYLPIAMVPRLKMILAAFYTVGCDFEGQQQALGDAWFVMYPSIVNFVLIYASLLNTVAKLFRRRMSDWAFPFTIIALSVMHFCRQLVSSSSLLHTGGRMSTVVDSDEFERLTVMDMLAAGNALRMGGNVPIVLWFKLLILSVNLLPLILSDSMALESKRSLAHSSCKAERSLKFRACNVGGIGRSNRLTSESTLSSYELIRLGYVVIGDRYLVTIEDWLVLTTMNCLKSAYSWWNYRIMAFQVTGIQSVIGEERAFELSSHGQLRSIHDPVLNSIAWWDIDVRPLL